MMELYENSFDLNFNLNEHMQEEDVIMFGNKSNGSDSGNSDGIPIKQRNQANARERFRTHRFVSMNCDQ
jgi:hypothetical protein